MADQKEVAPVAEATPEVVLASPPEPNEEEDDDALSLNFLFYIIETYKFSDLIGE